MRVLLLNPPGKKLYLRDYYCSKISKANYINQPTDLVILSGILDTCHEVIVIDAVIEKLNDEETLSRIRRLAPDIVVFLSGSVSFEEDFRFLEKVKKATKARLIGTGDIFMEDSGDLLKKYKFIDAVLLDFTTDDILKWIDGKIKGKIIGGNGRFKIPVPRHDLFKNHLYRYPFIRREPFATVLTNYGCPFRCSFCIMNKLKFKMREVDEVIEELKFLKKIGIRGLYFNDQTFGIDEGRTKDLLKKMIPLGFTWVCFSRVDVVNYEILKLMKKAGCHTIMFGVESGNQKILDKSGKGLKKEDIRRTFGLCKELGINTLGTFMIGLPGDTYETCLETIEFAKEIDCDFAAFNIPVPRMGTDLRKDAIKKKLISKDVRKMDQSGSEAVMGNENLTIGQLEKLHKKAYHDFYFRPGYILKRLLKLKTFTELKNHIRDGLGLIFKKEG